MTEDVAPSGAPQTGPILAHSSRLEKVSEVLVEQDKGIHCVKLRLETTRVD
jgi:hypothetical protein